jgi:hypothetical protein
MLCQKHVCVEVGNPLLALLRDPKVTQGIHNKRLHHLPKKLGYFARRSTALLYFSLLLIPVIGNQPGPGSF